LNCLNAALWISEENSLLDNLVQGSFHKFSLDSDLLITMATNNFPMNQLV